MAETDRGIYYPTKAVDGNQPAKVIEKMEMMAESIDDALDDAVEEATYDDTSVKARLTTIEAEQITQNTNIQANATAISNIKDGTTIDSFGDVETALSNKEDKSNKVTSISSSSTDTQYPSAKCVYDELEVKQDEIQELQEENEKLKKALPQIKGTGTNITLNNTSDNKFNELGVGGNTEQEQLTGKNLLDLSKCEFNSCTLNSDGSITCNIENYYYSQIYTTSLNDYLLAHKGQAITFSIDKTLNNKNIGIVINGIRTSSNYQEVNISNSKSATVTIANDFSEISNIQLRFNRSSTRFTDTTTVVKEIMVEEGSTATDFEPYVGGIPSPNPDFPQQIKNVTGDVNVKIQNKNLLYNSMLPYTQAGVTISCENDIYELNGTASQASNAYIIPYRTPLMHIEAGDSITFYIERVSGTSKVYFTTYLNPDDGSGYDYNWGITLNENVNSYKVVKTATKSGYIDHVQFFLNKDVVYNSKVKILIQKGDITNPSWVPHQEQNLPLTLGTQRLYEESYLADDGIHNPIYRQTTLGNVSALQSATLFGTPCKYGGFTLSNAKNVGRSYNFKSNKISPANETYGQYTGYRNGYNFVVMTDVNDTVENFNSKISGSIVEYELAQEEIIPYNETQQAQYNAIKEAMSYYKQTNISSTSDEISAVIEANAVGDLNLILT